METYVERCLECNEPINFTSSNKFPLKLTCPNCGLMLSIARTESGFATSSALHVKLPRSGAIASVDSNIAAETVEALDELCLAAPDAVMRARFAKPAADNTTAQLQAEVFAWCAETFKGQTLAGGLQHLWEELHELHATNYSDEVVEEIVDCGLLVMEIASMSSVVLERPVRFNVLDEEGDFNITAEFEQNLRVKFEECKKREWCEDEQGIFRHVTKQTG